MKTITFKQAKKKTIITSLVLILNFVLGTGNCYAQFSLLWTQTSNPSGSSESAVDIISDSSGIYVAGTDYSTSTGLPLWRIEKYTLNTGAVIWTQTSNLMYLPNNLSINLSITTDASGVYVAGSGVDMFNPGGAWCIEKRNLSTGALIWAQINSYASAEYITDIVADASGIYVVGYHDNASGYFQWRMEKRNSTTGALIWVQTSNLSPNFSQTTACTIDTSGIYVSGITIPFFQQGHIEKRSLNTGALIWAQTTSILFATPNAITSDATGIYVSTFNFIEKRDLITGALIWGSQGASFVYADITANTNGIYVVGSDTTSNGDYRWSLEKRDLNTGALLCTQTSNPSGSSDIAYAITCDIGGIYVAGFDSTPGNAQWHIEKYDLCGTNSIETFSNNSLWDLTLQNIPCTDELLGTLIMPENAHVRTEIYDLQGRKLLSSQLSVGKGNNLLQFDLRNISSGIYFLKVFNNEEQITKKFVKL